MKQYTVAVVGATGAVGRKMVEVLEEKNFPVKELKPLATAKSAGTKVKYKGQEWTVQAISKEAFEGVDIALFSAGGAASLEWAPIAAQKGAIVIDNSSAWRMDPEVPLVTPEVNPDDVAKHKGIIANPNCSTIQMVVALKPLHDYAKIKRIIVSTYQAVSGTGMKAIELLKKQTGEVLAGEKANVAVYPHQIAFNALPQIDVFEPNGYTKEEMKMINETKKIMGDNSIEVTATTVRIPVFFGHSESINIETEKKLTVEKAMELLSKAPGVVVVDNPANLEYPMAINAQGKDEVFVGRLREDFTIENGLNLWVVADNLRKGAASNAVQIAHLLVEKGLV